MKAVSKSTPEFTIGFRIHDDPGEVVCSAGVRIRHSCQVPFLRKFSMEWVYKMHHIKDSEVGRIKRVMYKEACKHPEGDMLPEMDQMDLWISFDNGLMTFSLEIDE